MGEGLVDNYRSKVTLLRERTVEKIVLLTKKGIIFPEKIDSLGGSIFEDVFLTYDRGGIYRGKTIWSLHLMAGYVSFSFRNLFESEKRFLCFIANTS